MEYKNDNNCYTYFGIDGDFDVMEMSQLLGARPFRTYEKDKNFPAGDPRGFASACYFKQDKYNVDINEMVRNVIAQLEVRKDLLKSIKKHYNANYAIIVVPYIYADSPNPHPVMPTDRDVMRFCVENDVDLVIDYYVF